MQSDKLIEEKGVSEDVPGTESGCRTETIKLIDMGAVSVETKGYIHGLELGFTPKN